MRSKIWLYVLGSNVLMLLFNVASVFWCASPVVAMVSTAISVGGCVAALYAFRTQPAETVVIVARRRWRDRLGDL